MTYAPPAWAYRPARSTYGSPPDSRLPVTDTFRSRLGLPGFLVRSIDVGSNQNSITFAILADNVNNNWLVTIAGLGIVESYTTPIPVPVIDPILFTSTPGFPTDLQSQVASRGRLATILRPTDDVVSAGTDSQAGRTVTNVTLDGSGNLVTTNLAGGTGVGSPGALRTGPDRSIVFSRYSELGNPDGTATIINHVLQWEGADVVNGSFQPYP